jgi:Family of unknown function (DUF5519)
MNTSHSEKLERPHQQSSARDASIRHVSSWKGVSVGEHRFGAVEFRLGRRELGHLHCSFADLPLPRPFREEVVASGRAKPHHVVPNSGWVTVPMRTASDAENVIDLFRLNYERAVNAVDEHTPIEDLSNTENDQKR